MPHAYINGANLHFEIQGQGQPLLLIMGLGAPAAAWDPTFVQELSKTNQVITYDNRGTGLSDKPDELYSIAMFASDTAGLLDALKIPRAHTLGVSMGGMIAQEMAIHYPQKVASLILGCTTPGGRNAVPAPSESMKMLEGRAGMNPEEAGREGWKLSFSTEFIREHLAELEANLQRALVHVTPRFAYERHLQATMTLRVFKQLKDIKAPTLVATGRDDILIPAANSEILAHEIPGAELAIFNNAGHGFVTSARDPFLKVLKPFLAKHGW
ncbi:MAG: alpha/beta fold hydrolase [Candidatus Tectomicrobia bacterium]|uniref:Alpha/beta fold hydrolase n=1 Tax=Tectimicrobiota bacterium TaxID=2528274 RepID=A0A933LQC2_UNCTE|nr:alpha/beta fold hydrolase [Candidatus Tectomicrobia bacterium]